MNGKISKELRRKAFNEWVKLKPEYQKLFNVKTIYKQMKKKYKKGIKIEDITIG